VVACTCNLSYSGGRGRSIRPYLKTKTESKKGQGHGSSEVLALVQAPLFPPAPQKIAISQTKCKRTGNTILSSISSITKKKKKQPAGILLVRRVTANNIIMTYCIYTFLKTKERILSVLTTRK
jgi:hypothetical protein